MKTKFFYLTVMLVLLLAGCKDKNNVTNEPPQPEPVITDISPDQGKSGVEVTITGMNFGITPEENTVTFNGITATVTGAGETGLTAEVPPEAGSGPVAVTVAGQTATGPEFTWFPDNTRFVDGINGDDQGGDNTCGDVEFPCRTLSHAIEVAFGGDILEIADAEYTESLTIDKPLTLRGESEDGTIIQAHEQPGQATSRVITIENIMEVIISDVTIRHGVANGIVPDDRGGGVFMTDASGVFTNVTFIGNSAARGGGVSLGNVSGAFNSVTFSGNSVEGRGGGMRIEEGGDATLSNVVFLDNRADSSGGGMFVQESFPTLTNVTFSGNSVEDRGGGMFNIDSSPTLTNVTFSGNSAEQRGGGMDNLDSSPTLTNVTFSGNNADRGGGMFNLRSSPTLTSVTFRGNSAESHGGGGMYDLRGSPILTDVIFEGNTAGSGGGGMRINDGDATLNNVVFLDNRADNWGGGMFIEESSPTLTNVLFHGNWSDRGGGIYNFVNSSPSLTNVTFSGNSADVDGGAMRNAEESSPTLLNTIVWGNTAEGEGNEIANHPDASIELRYSLYRDGPDNIVEGGGFEAENSLTDDPLFVDAGDGNLRLQTGSPAVDAGDPDTDADIFPDGVDLDGNPRVVGDRIDMGAYEHQEN